MVMHAVATASSRPMVISRSKAQVFPSSGPLITSRTYIAGPPSRGPDGRSSCRRIRGVVNPDDELFDIEPDALRAAEFMQARQLLSAMEGRRIVAARLGETRIEIETDDGSVYYFYGFMGEERPNGAGVA